MGMQIKKLEQVSLLGPARDGAEYRLEIFRNPSAPENERFEGWLYVRRKYGGVLIGAKPLEIWEFVQPSGPTRAPTLEDVEDTIHRALDPHFGGGMGLE